MKWILLCLVIACAGCTDRTVPAVPAVPAADTAHWRIALTADPAAPRQLDPTRFTVQVTDSGKPVSSAGVEVQLSMPTMDMGRNEVTAQPQSAGTYIANGRFTMPGDWQVTVIADHGKLHQTQSFPIQVQ